MELEHFFCGDLIDDDNMSVTPLYQIKENPSCGFSFDCVENRFFFMKEEFVTFDCSETFVENCCEFKLISQIPWMNHLAWGIFNYYNVSIEHGNVNRRTFSKQTYVSQEISFELLNDFGYFQLICLPEKIAYDGAIYHKYDILTFMVFRDLNVKKSLAFPHLITICPNASMTYMPIVSGQCVQLLCPEYDRVENKSDLEFIKGTKKTFSISRNDCIKRLQTSTYRCNSNKEGFIHSGDKTITFPEIFKENGKACVQIQKPLGNFDVYVKGIDCIYLQCSDDIDDWMWDKDYFEVGYSSEGIYIQLLQPFEAVSIILGYKICEVVVSYTLGNL